MTTEEKNEPVGIFDRSRTWFALPLPVAAEVAPSASDFSHDVKDVY